MRAEGRDVTVISGLDGAGDVRASLEGGAAFRRAAAMGGRVDRIEVHFQPSLYYRPRAAFSKVLTSASLLWLVLRRRQTEIVVHEADRPTLWRPDYFLLRLAFGRARRLVFHTDAERQALEEQYRVRPRYRLVEHTQGVQVHAPLSRREARRRLRLDPRAPLYLCAGFLHPDKGFERAVQAFGRSGASGGARVVILGSVRERTPRNLAYARTLRDLCERTPGATLVEGYVSDEDFDAWIAAADRLVLPYRSSWSSGALARARALGTPAIVSAVGGLPEQAGPDDAVFTDDAELAELLRASAPAAVEGGR
jgi:glycosyltransferase involved in cell wall biosynthesis